MNEIEESLRTLSAAPPLRPSPSLDTMSRRASTYRSERRRRHLGGVGIVALLLGGGVVAGLGLASTGGIQDSQHDTTKDLVIQG
jgi:ferric-dicitrate binding protein FerR (iron transport regulator)